MRVCRPKPEARYRPAGRSPGPGADSAAPKPPPTRDAAATAHEEASFQSYSNHVSEMDGGSKQNSSSTVISGAQARSDIGPDMERISLLSLFPVAVTGPQPSGPTGQARTVTVSFRPGSRPPRGRHVTDLNLNFELNLNFGTL
jgi:hypothetical protein